MASAPQQRTRATGKTNKTTRRQTQQLEQTAIRASQKDRVVRVQVETPKNTRRNILSFIKNTSEDWLAFQNQSAVTWNGT